MMLATLAVLSSKTRTATKVTAYGDTQQVRYVASLIEGDEEIMDLGYGITVTDPGEGSTITRKGMGATRGPKTRR